MCCNLFVCEFSLDFLNNISKFLHLYLVHHSLGQSNQERLDSGGNSLSLTQDSALTAGTALTFTTTIREHDEMGQDVISEETIIERYIQSELRYLHGLCF